VVIDLDEHCRTLTRKGTRIMEAPAILHLIQSMSAPPGSNEENYHQAERESDQQGRSQDHTQINANDEERQPAIDGQFNSPLEPVQPPRYQKPDR